MFRWRLFATRLSILLLSAAAIWISRDALLRRYLIYTAESNIGAKVEIGQLYTSIKDRKIFVKHLVVADPRDPMKNLLQAESAVLKLDMDALSKRRFIIENGATNQLVFGSPRTNSGELHATDFHKISALETNPEEFSITLDQADPRESWLDHFKFSKTNIDPDKLELTATAKNIFQDLDSNLDQHLTRMQELKLVIAQINDLVDQYDENVLRSENLRNAQQMIGSVGQDVDSIATQLSQLDIQVATYQTALTEARNRDAAALLRKSPRNSIDGATISGLLLNQDQLQRAEEVLKWYLAFKKSIPNPRSDFKKSGTIGKNVFLPGLSTSPSFLIKSMELDGEGRIAGQKFSFTGEVCDFALEPHLIDRPTTCQLRAQGNTHFVVNCSIDHSDRANAKDSIQMICPDISLPARILPSRKLASDDEIIKLSVSPCRWKIDIELTCVDDHLQGRFIFDYENLVTQIVHLDEMAGGQAIADLINLELGAMSNYQVTANIGGTISRPTINFQSNLGNRLATKLNKALGSETMIANQQIDELLNRYQARLNNEFAENIRQATETLQSDIVSQQATIIAELNRLPNPSANRLRR